MKIVKEKILSKFNCQKSGNCCRTSGIVYASHSELQAMAKELDIDLASFLRNYTKKENGWTVISTTRFRPNCFLTKTNTCSIYQSRPKKCRSYPNWPEIWESKNSLMKEAALCPALKKAIMNITQ